MEKFKLTYEWLHKYYGSHTPQQEFFARKWLDDYGTNVTPEKKEIWGRWKDLTEYQANTEDIVDQCLSWIGDEFESELEAHRNVNILRVPLAMSYEEAFAGFETPVKRILELGTGGDSGISTSIFLYYLEQNKGKEMLSIDRNPLGRTWERYKDVPFWSFRQDDSVNVLHHMVDSNIKWDLVFIDTDHSYTTTKKEMELASQITDIMLLDDANFPGNATDPEPGGVDKARQEFVFNHGNWEEKMFHGTAVSLITKKIGKVNIGITGSNKKLEIITPKPKSMKKKRNLHNLKSELPKGVLNE